jgi:hypothetical protein
MCPLSSSTLAAPASRAGADRVQTVRIPAVLVHRHSVKTELANGCGRINLTERKALVPASTKIATTSTISLYVHRVQIIALTPVLAWLEDRSWHVFLM